MKIEELGLTDRTCRALQRNGVHSVEQLMELTPGEVYTLRGIGEVGFDDILHCLERQKKKAPGR